jgi:hypothetical protein
VISPGVKWLGHEADHSPPLVLRSRKEELYLHSPICLHGTVLDYLSTGTGHSPHQKSYLSVVTYISKTIHCLKIKELQVWNDTDKKRTVAEEYSTAKKRT